MDDATWAMLNETEKALLREVEPRRLEGLDEDELAALHDRIRRARNKYSKLYRRRAAEHVTANATRAKAHAAHARTVAKAEAFEEALAAVSQRLARVARASAAALRKERIAAARGGTGASAETVRDAGARKAAPPAGTSRAKAKRRTPATKKASASSRASTRRAQAKRDTRSGARTR